MSMNAILGPIASLELIKPEPPPTDQRILCPVGYKQDPSLTSNYQLMRRPVAWNVDTQAWEVGAYALAEFNCQVDMFTVWTPEMKWNFTTNVSAQGYDIQVNGIFRMGTEADPLDWQLEINAYCLALRGRPVHLFWDKYLRDNYNTGPRLTFGSNGWARTGIRHTRISSGKHNIKSNERCAVAVMVVG